MNQICFRSLFILPWLVALSLTVSAQEAKEKVVTREKGPALSPATEAKPALPQRAHLALLAGEVSRAAGVEVIEIGTDKFGMLPGGKEADGIVGDFVLRNDRIEAVISGNLPLRRPNMSAFYGEGNETPGCLFDLTLKGASNDQITIFSPASQKGAVNYVKPYIGGKRQRVGVETMVTAAKKDGISRQHLYLLEDGWQGLLIETHLINETDKEAKVSVKDLWTQMRVKGTIKGIQWADAINPAHKCGYAFAWVQDGGATIPTGDSVNLRPGEKMKVARFLAVAESPAAAVGLVAAFRDSKSTGGVKVTFTSPDEKAVTDARVMIKVGDSPAVPAYPNDKGVAEFAFIAGDFDATAEDIGRDAVSRKLSIAPGRISDWDCTMTKRAAIQFKIVGDDGEDTPCKIQFHPRKGTSKVNLGPTDRAHGCVDQWHSETGDFTVPLPVGEYRIIVTRGPEFDAITRDVTVAAGEVVAFDGQLERTVWTDGWISADFHNHSTPSGDNTCGTPDRLINLAAEHIEFAPTTEHNRIYDWAPQIAELGLTPFLTTVPGMELTGRGAHFNTFPLKPEPMKQDGGAPVWQKDPRLNAIVLRDYQGQEPDRWVHVNHPDMTENFIDRNGDGRADGGYAYFGNMLDGLETQNYRGTNILADAPFSIGKARTGLGKQVSYHREFIWLQLLNQGLDVWGIGVADSHHVYGNGVGSWRTYLPSPSDDPEEIDWREVSAQAKNGRMIVSSGPFLKVMTGMGTIAGGHERSNGSVLLKVSVQCSNWLDIDRVQVLVNGRQDPRYNYTREKNPEMFEKKPAVMRFQETLKLDLSEDAHLIVVAIGENETLQQGFGTSTQASYRPCAYNNPIFIDVDRGGFEPNYDTLGYDLPVKGLSVEAVEKLLGR
ncbi:MAG: CehA/McbA family metallohydrolase [Verrucomicrobiales bacterium]|nr:CehA/McbA family metallohydrolase [Verrucomicrobiales bacterium]